jgi:hypothetical protein
MRVASFERSYLLEMETRIPGFMANVLSKNPFVAQGGGGIYSCMSGRDHVTGNLWRGKTLQAAIEEWAKSLPQGVKASGRYSH